MAAIRELQPDEEHLTLPEKHGSVEIHGMESHMVDLSGGRGKFIPQLTVLEGIMDADLVPDITGGGIEAHPLHEFETRCIECIDGDGDIGEGIPPSVVIVGIDGGIPQGFHILVGDSPHQGVLAAVFVVVGYPEVAIATPAASPAVLAQPCPGQRSLGYLYVIPSDDGYGMVRFPGVGMGLVVGIRG